MSCCLAQANRPVHPRVCGERRACAATFSGLAGSSPRVRGTLGKRCHRRIVGAVHPRVCGERAQAIDKAGIYNGSSPRVRGTLI